MQCLAVRNLSGLHRNRYRRVQNEYLMKFYQKNNNTENAG